MINKDLVFGLKGHRTTDATLDKVASSFPLVFGNLLRLMSVILPPCYVFNFMFERDKFMAFILTLGNAIHFNQFDFIDNIILEFLSSYNYIIPPYKVIIDLDPKEVDKFTVLCNGFKGKEWNDILSPLVDGIYDLLNTATANGQKINLG